MSASPTSAKSLKSPATMPPPLGTPTRLQTLRNQSLKLHLPGSGRNYISLGLLIIPSKRDLVLYYIQ